MNKVRMQRYVEAVLPILEDHSLTAGGAVDRSMVGKVASFGPTVYQMGLKPAVMLYSNPNSDADRKPVVEALWGILRVCVEDIPDDCDSLLAYVQPLQGDALHMAKEQILDICVVLKLALRTFPVKSA